MKKMRFEKWQLIVLSVFYIVFGIISAAVPREQFLTFFNILGLIIMVIGAFSIFIYFLRKDYLEEHNFQVAFGALYIMAGMIVWLKPELIVSNYPLVFAGCVVIDSAIRLQYSMNLFRMKDQGWLWVFVSALAAIALAAVILLADLGHDLQRILLTVLLCFDGISNLATLFYERDVYKRQLSAGVLRYQQAARGHEGAGRQFAVSTAGQSRRCV